MLWLPIQKWECGEFGIHGYLAAALTWWTPFPGHLAYFYSWCIFKISCSCEACVWVSARPQKGGREVFKNKKKKKKKLFFFGKKEKKEKKEKRKKIKEKKKKKKKKMKKK